MEFLIICVNLYLTFRSSFEQITQSANRICTRFSLFREPHYYLNTNNSTYQCRSISNCTRTLELNWLAKTFSFTLHSVCDFTQYSLIKRLNNEIWIAFSNESFYWDPKMRTIIFRNGKWDFLNCFYRSDYFIHSTTFCAFCANLLLQLLQLCFNQFGLLLIFYFSIFQISILFNIIDHFCS